MKPPDEWMAQADYDMDTAKTMYRSGRYFYAVFMCHLSLEKGLKGLYAKHAGKEPQKTHDLVLLGAKTGLNFPPTVLSFIATLSSLSVPTRYPDTLKNVLTAFTKENTRKTLKQSREALKWFKTQL